MGSDDGQRAQKYFDLPLDIDPLGCVIVGFPLNTTPQPPRCSVTLCLAIVAE